MARYDENGNWLGAVPKPESTKKTKSKPTKSKIPTKGVDMEAVEAKKRTRTEQNKVNRNFGKSVEYKVAELTGGERVPMSGAIKNSVFNLEGDVRVRYPNSKEILALIECKGMTSLAPKGEKSFTVKKGWLDQATAEAELQHAIGVVWLHLKGESYEDGYAIINVKHFLKLLELAKENN
jgi:hypothetical protein